MTWWAVLRRGVVTMTQPCMLAYSLLLIKTCHRRGVHAMGGMAAQIPIKNDPAANEAALKKASRCRLHQSVWVISSSTHTWIG